VIGTTVDFGNGDGDGFGDGDGDGFGFGFGDDNPPGRQDASSTAPAEEGALFAVARDVHPSEAARVRASRSPGRAPRVEAHELGVALTRGGFAATLI
jgi:hypothetical protein